MMRRKQFMNRCGFHFAFLLAGYLLLGLLAPQVSANAMVDIVDSNLYKDPQKALTLAEQSLKSLPATSPDRPHWEVIAAESALILELPEQALPHIESGIAALTEQGIRTEVGQRLQTALASVKNRTGHMTEAFKTINESIAILESSQLPKWLLVEALTERADMYNNTGNFRAASADLLRAYSLATEKGNRGTRGDVASYLGAIYMTINEYPLAIQYYREALASAKVRNELVTQSISEYNLAMVLQLSGQYLEAEQLYKDSLLHSEKIKDQQGIAFAQLGLADIALHQKKFKESEKLYRSILPAFVASNNTNSQAAIALSLADIAKARNQDHEAIKQAKIALSITQNSNNPDLEMSAHNLLGKLYAKNAEFKLAYEHNVLARKLEKKKLEGTRDLYIANMEERFASERHKQENKLLQQKNQFNEHQLSDQKRLTTAYFAVSLLLLLFVGFLVHASYKNNKLRDKLSKLALTDVLTGIANRRSVMSIFEQEFNRASRYEFPLSIAMIDLDHFKTINDSFGHDAGDKVLSEFCQLVREHLRITDSFGRWGGEEFIIILPHTSASDAVQIINRIRESMVDLPYKKLHSEMNCSFSGGIAYQKPDDTDVNAILKRADEALYTAKNAGRNRVVLG
ncbi:MAG TPA: diguanylate cyclase [Arenimonas sp.]|nr:diguanylate cyclase [Arenimonas sp.]